MTGSRLVCFDLGRVLVRISDSVSDAFERAGLKALVPDVEDRLRDRTARKALEGKLHALEHGTISPEAFCIESAKLLGRSSAEVARMLDAFVHGAYPGAVELLDDLAKAGVRTACLSNTNVRHFELMTGWLDPADRVLARIELRYTSHELGLRKPSPDIYKTLEARAGFAPADIVFFDDLPANIDAAKACGWDAELVRSKQDPVAEMRAHLVHRGLL